MKRLNIILTNFWQKLLRRILKNRGEVMFLFEKFQVEDGRECKLILPEAKYAEEMYNIIDNGRQRLSD